MRAISFTEFGQPLDVLSLSESPTPEPGKGEVRLRLTHRPINPADFLSIMGYYPPQPQLPATAGMEGTGYVDAIGEGAEGFGERQRVIPLDAGNTWAEYKIVNSSQLLPVSDKVSDQSAAQFLVNPTTAWIMLTEELGLKEGEWVVQTAAGSTLGRIVLQLAKLKGYKTINLVRRREQVQELLNLGADAAICTEDDDLVDQVMKLTNGQGVSGAIDAVSGETASSAAACLQEGGTMLVYGAISMEFNSSYNNVDMIFKGTSIRGFWISQWFRSKTPQEISAVLSELMELMANGHLTPPVEAEYDLADFRSAIEHTVRQGRSGKVLLTG